MGKYETLGRHLAGLGRERILMTFREIEEVAGAPLPASARKHRSWWSNTPAAGYVWLEAGYRTTEVDIPGETLVFERLRPGARPYAGLREDPPSPFVHAAPAAAEDGAPHPLYGLMKGRIRVREAASTDSSWEAETMERLARSGL